MTPRPQPPRDHDVRERIVRGIDRSCLVEASAGTGKTKLLVDRILHLLRTTDARIEGVVAITFTEKAAGELKARLTDALRASRDDCLGRGEAVEAERLDTALGSLDRAAVTTIHSFCARLLRERPVEARVSPGFGVLDESASAALMDEAWEAWLGSELEGEDTPLLPAVEAGVREEDLREMAGVMVRNRDLLEDLERAIPMEQAVDPEAALASYVAAVQALAERVEILLAACRAPGADKARNLIHPRVPRILTLAARLGAGDPRAGLWALEDPGLPGITSRGRKSDWDPGSLDELRRLVAGATEAHAAMAEARRTAVALQALRALQGFLVRYEQEKTRRGKLDFEDLLIRARNLLRDDPAVRADLQVEFTHLFVDEFQDTDPLQAEIAFYLAGSVPSARSWAEARPGPGRLFIVGDPKQSIYRFRRADIQMYARARRLLGEAGGSLEIITENFRTVPAITGWVNRVFQRLMPPDQAEDFRPAYSRLEPHRGDPGDERRRPQVRSLRLVPPEGGEGGGKRMKAEERRRMEALAVAGLIRRRIESGAWDVSERRAAGEAWRPASWGDVAVLFRTHSALVPVEDAFRTAGIPYRVEGGRFYFKRQEVQSLLAVLRAVDNPLDREALVAALRSPLFGFDDETLLLAAAEGRLDYGAATSPSDPGLAAAFDLLRGWHLRRHSDSPALLVEEILTRTRAVEFFLMKPLGEQRAANLAKVIDEARRYEGEAGGFRAFIRRLSEREAALEAESESPTLEEGDGEFVHLLSIHRAKGLEFPIVVLVDLAGRARNQPDVLIDRARGRMSFRLSGIAGHQGTTPSWTDLKARDDQEHEAELTRLFYVATTRARDLLILPIPPDGSKEGFLKLLSEEDVPPPLEPGILTPEEMEEPVFRHRGRMPGPEDEEGAEALSFEEARSRFRGERDALLRSLPPAARVVAPSGLAAHPDDVAPAAEPPETAAEGEIPSQPPGGPAGVTDLGRAVGGLVHAVLQRVDPAGRTAGAWIDALWGEIMPRDAGSAAPARAPLREHVERLVRTALEHPLWKKAHSAGALSHEAPFFARAGANVYLNGIVDLAFEESGGLVLVDFKTDALGPEGVDPLFARYRGQGLAYALGVTAAAGLPVREVIFLFLATGETRSLVVDDAVLAEAAVLVEG